MGEIFSPPLIQAQTWQEAQRKFNEIIRQMARQLNNIYTGANIPTDRIKADAITGAKIADDQVDSEHFVAGSIDTEHLAADCVTAAKILAGTITADEIATNAITSVKILADAVTATKINVVGLDGTTGRIVVADATDADAITGGINSYASTEIQPGKILISGSTSLDDWRHGTDATKIDGGDIYANTVTATQISVTQLDAISANVGTLTAGTITSALTVNSLWRLVDTWTCTTAATSHTFSGLTGDTAIEYMIKCRWVRYRDGAADPMNYIMCCNDDTAANYGFSTNWTVNGASGGSENAAFDGIWIGRADENGEISQGQGILHAISGYTRTFSGQFSACVNGADVERIYNCECSWTNTADQITSLVFYAETASGIGVGSQIDIYARIA